MLKNLPTLTCGGPTRRAFLSGLAATMGGLGLTGLPSLRAAQKEAAQKEAAQKDAASKQGQHSPEDTAVIFIWLPGGPSHLETFDLKPDAPSEFRGDFRPIRTNVAGVSISEHLPQLARLADKYALVRSIAHTFSDHGGGHKRFMTGRDPLLPVGFVNDYPAVGSMIAKVRETRRVGVPNYVAGMDNGRQGIDVFSLGAAYLGPSTYPFTVPGDPADAKFEVRNVAPIPELAHRLAPRLELLRRLDTLPGSLDPRGAMSALDANNQRAVELLTADRARTAFDLSQEPDKLRDRYGRHRYGQRCLMARRLVEAGSLFVTMVLENTGHIPTDCTYNWDSHAVNGSVFTDTKHKSGFLDQAVSALIEDLYSRGLDKRVLLVVTGEFGRTPRISYKDGRPGRDHWPQAMSVLVSGGGVAGGQVIGATNARGEHPIERILSPNDLWATVLRHLAIDYNDINFLDHQGRPMPLLPFGEPITELLPRA